MPVSQKLREDQKAVGLEIGIDKDAVVSSIAQGAEDEILVINGKYCSIFSHNYHMLDSLGSILTDSIDDIVNPERSCFDSILASVFEVIEQVQDRLQ